MGSGIGFICHRCKHRKTGLSIGFGMEGDAYQIPALERKTGKMITIDLMKWLQEPSLHQKQTPYNHRSLVPEGDFKKLQTQYQQLSTNEGFEVIQGNLGLPTFPSEEDLLPGIFYSTESEEEMPGLWETFLNLFRKKKPRNQPQTLKPRSYFCPSCKSFSGEFYFDHIYWD